MYIITFVSGSSCRRPSQSQRPGDGDAAAAIELGATKRHVCTFLKRCLAGDEGVGNTETAGNPQFFTVENEQFLLNLFAQAVRQATRTGATHD
jgi:hypothetical protein